MTDIIHAYTRQQALKDGVLIRLEDFLDAHKLAGQVIVAALHSPMVKRFTLGELVITRAAAAELPPDRVVHSLIRHSQGDWGQLDAHDRELNERGLDGGGRLFSVYAPEDAPRFYIITEWNREATTVLLPEDY